MRLILSCLLAAVPVSASAQEVDLAVVNGIVDQGLNHSEVMETAAYLTDRIGGRLTNSPQMRQAESWARQRFRSVGLTNVSAEAFTFGRGWSIRGFRVRMTEPRPLELVAIPVAWTPPSAGTITAPIIVAPMEKEEDFTKWRGQLAGRIVLITHPGTGSEPDRLPFRRLTADELSERDLYRQPTHEADPEDSSAERHVFTLALDRFLADEGALAWIRMSYRDGGLVHGTGYTYRIGETPSLPAMEMAAEDYRLLARLALTDSPPELAFTSDVQFHDDDPNAYNIFGDIAGSDPDAGYVMAGAHLDSWVAGDGAQDNAAGSAIVIEAARILRALGVRPKRTIRFALWGAEEQGLLGSHAFVERHLASRPPETDPEKAELPPHMGWTERWPLTLKRGHADLVAYFNVDNGSGRFRGIHAEGNVAVVPIFRQWLAPFASMGATLVASRPTGGTDHVFMQHVGIPAFQFIQDPLDYGSRIHHTSIDSYDHLKPEDMRQASIILASFLLNAANLENPLPRMPLPSEPRLSDPFEIPKPE